MVKNNMNFNKVSCRFNSKINNRENRTIIMIFVCCFYVIIILELLNVFKAVELDILKSFKVNSLNTLCSSSIRLFFFFANNHNMNVNSKHCFITLNIKLKVKVRFKMFWLLKWLNTAFVLNAITKTACSGRNFCIS